MSPAPRIAISAPGSGLGHLARACALGLALQDRGAQVQVLTNSPLAPWFTRSLGLPVEVLPDVHWARAVRTRIARLAPDLLVTDTFPWGLRGEWVEPPAGPRQVAHLARRLKLDAYLERLGRTKPAPSPMLDHVVLLEPLSPNHRALVAETADQVTELGSRIRLERPASAVTQPLREFFRRHRVWLVVHSGPAAETTELVRTAWSHPDRRSSDPILVVTPNRPPGLPSGASWLPSPAASGLFPLAHRVLSGAGYNLVAEMAGLRNRHLPIPFPRRFDDQAGRLAAPAMAPAGGLARATDFLWSLL